jgi:hypothetical protein
MFHEIAIPVFQVNRKFTNLIQQHKTRFFFGRKNTTGKLRSAMILYCYSGVIVTRMFNF